ncbi:unnamed protein product [Clavelina lepadiformis]|uniref:Uncharacterized protein n=1 Tax=Clavelina lepadiformis TaxID=159417 RepID=A0ABP0FJW8_CLALP
MNRRQNLGTNSDDERREHLLNTTKESHALRNPLLVRIVGQFIQGRFNPADATSLVICVTPHRLQVQPRSSCASTLHSLVRFDTALGAIGSRFDSRPRKNKIDLFGIGALWAFLVSFNLTWPFQKPRDSAERRKRERRQNRNSMKATKVIRAIVTTAEISLYSVLLPKLLPTWEAATQLMRIPLRER